MGPVKMVYDVWFFDEDWQDMASMQRCQVRLPEVVQVMKDWLKAWQYPNSDQCPDALRSYRKVTWISITPTIYQYSPITGEKIYVRQ